MIMLRPRTAPRSAALATPSTSVLASAVALLLAGCGVPEAGGPVPGDRHSGDRVRGR